MLINLALSTFFFLHLFRVIRAFKKHFVGFFWLEIISYENELISAFYDWQSMPKEEMKWTAREREKFAM